jgi:hypothetical protein
LIHEKEKIFDSYNLFSGAFNFIRSDNLEAIEDSCFRKGAEHFQLGRVSFRRSNQKF